LFSVLQHSKQQLACVLVAGCHFVLANIVVDRQQEITPQCLSDNMITHRFYGSHLHLQTYI